jgi:mannose-6-phosphate isomerase-like protein (cupin superfamily)
MTMAEKPRYRVNRSELPTFQHTPAYHNNTGTLTASACHGSQTSWLFAERSPGYSSEPHRHDAEQINYFVSGEMWLFVEEFGYRCGPGDIIRIPPGKWHWARNRGAETAVVIETHSPSATNAQIAQSTVALLGPDEDPATIRHIDNLASGRFPGDVDAVEARAYREESRD